MRAFWWFKENAIGAMARPGFNAVHWFELPFDEAVLLGWLGQFSAVRAPLEAFRRHLKEYAPKIYQFHKLDGESGPRATSIFAEPDGFLEVFTRLNRRTNIFASFEVLSGDAAFSPCLGHSITLALKI